MSDITDKQVSDSPLVKGDTDSVKNMQSEVSTKHEEPSDTLKTSDELSNVINALKESVVVETATSPENELHHAEANDEQLLTATSEPSSPRPTAIRTTAHRELNQTVEVPEGQNMADYFTPPTPGLPPSSMELGDSEHVKEGVDENVETDITHEEDANHDNIQSGTETKEDEAGVDVEVKKDDVKAEDKNDEVDTKIVDNENKESTETKEDESKSDVKAEGNAVQAEATELENSSEDTKKPADTAVETTTASKKEEKPKDPHYIGPFNIDYDGVRANYINARSQEKYDADMVTGIELFFDNKFAEAREIFNKRTRQDPLYSLGLSSMAFARAFTSYNPKDLDTALARLTETFLFADAQVDAAFAKKPIADAVSHYFTNLLGTNPTNLPTKSAALNKYELQNRTFITNGALRAHIVRGESALLMSILYLAMDTTVGYIKAGENLRRAYGSYSYAWQEYKQMGQNYSRYIDRDSISGLQFGIGAVHLLLSSLPQKILKTVSAFCWSADKHLGFAMLKLCVEGKRSRSPIASLMLLCYYVTLTSHAPQVFTREFLQPAIECLLEAQKQYPNSAFFLFFAGRVSRLARNISVSTQSFVYTNEVCQGTWAEPAIGDLALFEIIINSTMGLDWTSTATKILELQPKYNNPALFKYLYGCCMEMLGDRTEAILSFAQISGLVDPRRNSQTELFIAHRVAFFEISGYQDLDFTLPMLELLMIWNLFPCMTVTALEKCEELVDERLSLVYEREKMEYEIRKVELAPISNVPSYYDQRGALLLIKASLLNALNRFSEGIVHLNWIIDNQDKFKATNWITPFAYWESGNVCWGTEDFKKARALWEAGLAFTDFDFENKVSIRMHLAVQHAIELGVPETIVPKNKGKTNHGRKRLSIIPTKSSSKTSLP
ncbi:hypothetical protein BD560DRAFT_391111 [Blakeslea trispora]|nr:hypothetical protein BD560DRAFT_391111 [Blakeslea trispora]